MYDSSEVLQIVGSIGILITALGAVIVNIIVAVRTGKKVDDSLKASQIISSQVQEVHTITNSNLSTVKSELAQAIGQLNEMKVFVNDLKNERDKLATITALNTPAPNSNSTSESEVLDSIDKNTESTANNTRKEKK